MVLIRTMISDQLAYLKIAKEWFTIADLNEIRTRKIGQGKIGGKSAGMLLAARILMEVADEEIRASLRLPESYFIGADLTYTFMALNGLMPLGRPEVQARRADPRRVPQDPERIPGRASSRPISWKSSATLLEHVGRKPLIVRSSSLLEDNFGTSFAGKYESFFCPNQGTPEQNLRDLTQAIITHLRQHAQPGCPALPARQGPAGL